ALSFRILDNDHAAMLIAALRARAPRDSGVALATELVEGRIAARRLDARVAGASTSVLSRAAELLDGWRDPNEIGIRLARTIQTRAMNAADSADSEWKLKFALASRGHIRDAISVAPVLG